MTVRQVQFAYDSEWYDRKIKLGVTWKKVMEAGIEALEVNGNKQKRNPNITKGSDSLYKKEIPEFYLTIEPHYEIETREFDKLFIFTDPASNKEKKEWRNVNIDEVDIGDIIRIRDDNVVVKQDGFKKFKKKTHIIEGEGMPKIVVEPVI